MWGNTKYGQSRPLTCNESELTRTNFLRSSVTIGIDENSVPLTMSELDGTVAVITRNDKVSPKTFVADALTNDENDPISSLLKQFNDVLGIPVRGYHYFETADNKAMVSIFTKSKYCQVIGADHLSNHAYIVCDLTNSLYYVKCFNEGCSGTKASAVSIFCW